MYILENNRKFINLNPKCEPQLGKRGVYRSVGGQKVLKDENLAMFWILNMSDGKNSLLEISTKSGISFEIIENVSKKMVENNLLKEIGWD